MPYSELTARTAIWQRRSLDGWWIAREAHLGGVRLPDEALPGLSMLIFNQTLYLGSDVGAIDVDHHVEPATIEVLIVRGPNRWRFIPGIFRRTGSVLRICFDLSGVEHPRSFVSPPGSRYFLVTFQRTPIGDANY